MFQGPKDYFKPGDWNAWCDRCGFKFKASELRKEWQGFMVCSGCWEPRNEQDFIRSVPEKPAPPFSRPRNDRVDNPFDNPMTDQTGTTYFIPFAPVDKSKL